MNQIYEIHKNTQESNIQSKSQPTIKNQLFNKAENAAKIIAQVMAIEKIETRLPKIGGWNEYLIQSEFKQQNRFINQLQIKHTNIEKCQELESALSDYRQIINLFTNLISQENSSYILSISTSSEIQTIKPAFNLLNLLDNFHLQSIIDFHNVLQNDPKGEELKENIINYQQKLSQYLYFHLIQEEDPNLKLLLTLVLMNHTQNNQKILQILNNYINSFDKFEKQKVVNFLKHIISIFDELSEYFNILIQVINDQSIQIDRKLQLNKKQFEIILLILDNSNYHSQQQSILLHLSIASSDVIRSIKWIYNPECSQEFVISQQKELTNNLSIKVDQNILQDLFLLLQKLRSVKLRLLIERIIEFHQKKEREIRLEFLEFNIFLPQDQETLNNIEFAYSNQIQIQQLPFNRFQSDLLVNNTIYSFSKILNLVAQCDKEQSNQNGQLFNTKAKMELKQLISDQIANFGAQYLPNLIKEDQIDNLNDVRLKMRKILVYFLWLQKIEQNTFEELWRFSEQLRIYVEKLDQQTIQNQQSTYVLPTLNSILSNYQRPQNEPQEYQVEKNCILSQISDQTDFEEMMNLIEQYVQTDKQEFIYNMKQYYKKEYKIYLEQLQVKSSEHVQQAIRCIFENVDV